MSLPYRFLCMFFKVDISCSKLQLLKAKLEIVLVSSFPNSSDLQGGQQASAGAANDV